MMFAVLGEDDSDAKSLTVLVRRIKGVANLTVVKKGFRGCGDLRQNACRVIRDFAVRGATRFIVCHDADHADPLEIRESVRRTLARDGCGRCDCEIVVPVQELEAWIIADENAITKVISSLKIPNERSPERIDNPKEWLRKRSIKRSKPIYVPSIHNERIAHYIDLTTLERKCPSFRPLKAFVNA
jgi:Domain of unknown function (DUF4276)